MRTPNLLPLAALVLVLTSGPAFRPSQAQSAAQSSVKLQIVSGLPVVDGVYINGQGPFRFLLDTGAQSNTLDVGLARRLNLDRGAELQLETPAGTTKVLSTTVNKLRLGSAEVISQEFVMLDRAPYSAFNVSGILGQEFLRRFDYLLDLKHRQLTFGATPPTGTPTPFRLVDGCMVLPTSLGPLMLDSGTATLMLFRASPELRTTAVTTSNGMFDASSEIARSVQISGKKYYPDDATAHSVPNAPAAGLLPINIFRAIYVSNSGGYVIFNPAD